MSQYSRDLNADDIALVRNAAKTECTSEQFAAEMNISVDQVWKFLHSPNGSSMREKFEQNDLSAASQSDR